VTVHQAKFKLELTLEEKEKQLLSERHSLTEANKELSKKYEQAASTVKHSQVRERPCGRGWHHSASSARVRLLASLRLRRR
jgi:hypothetical protein